MWQQNVQAGKRQSLDRWLHTLFPEPGESPNASFWTLHRHDELVRRWASVVGTANITAVVVEEGDHAFVLRAFESLLGLRPGTLVLERDLANRSLTYGEAEAVRAFDIDFRKDGGDRATHARVMRYGAAQHMKARVPGPSEGPIELPAWAIPRIAETGRDIGDRIAASGIRVIGDLSALAMTSPPSRAHDAAGDGPPDPAAPPEVAAAMSLGILHAAGVARRDEVATTDVAGLARTVPSYLVAGVIATRTQVAAGSRWRGARRQARRVAGAGRRAASERLGESGRYGRPRSSTIETLERMEPTRDLDPLVLPEGTRLLHIGPPKTGTTALQGAFHAARAAAEAQGVHYAGRHRHSMTAVQAVLGRRGFYTTEGSPAISHWRKLADEVRGSKAKRVVLSSEFFADATPEAIRRVVDDLDASRLHVVVTLRPLSKIIPSQWQQYVQSNLTTSFDDWLDAMFGQGQAKIWPSFWNRHRHDRLIARWAEVVGADRMTVVALDDADHDFVLRAFERLTGLTTGTLVSTPDVANRSLTMPEAEAVRAFNIAFGAEGLRSAAPQPGHELRGGALHAADGAAGRCHEGRDAAVGARQGRRGVARDDRRDRGQRGAGDRGPRTARDRAAEPPRGRPPAHDHRPADDRRQDGDGRPLLVRARDAARRGWRCRPEGLARDVGHADPWRADRAGARADAGPGRGAGAPRAGVRATTAAGRGQAARLISPTAGPRAARPAPRGSGARPRARRRPWCR